MRTTTRLKAAAVLTAAGLLAAPAAAQAAIYPGPNGARDVHGAIEAEWLALGKAPGDPLTDERPLHNLAGAYNDFTHQAIYWSYLTGAHTVGGDIYRYWGTRYRENGGMGYPASNEVPLARGGVLQRFQYATVYWSPTTGAHEVIGDIGKYWAAQGWENGALGYPTSNEIPLARGGVLQRFQHGTVHWSPGNGAHQVTGAFADVWANSSLNGSGGQWENGPLGYPTGDLAPAADGGTFQRFEHGAIYQRASGTPADPLYGPAVPVSVSGAFYPYWAANGYERGRFGWPLLQEWPTGSGTSAVYQPFQGGTLFFSFCTNAVTEINPDECPS